MIGMALKAQVDPKMHFGFADKVNDWLEEDKVPAAGIGIIENGRISYVKVFGELKKGTPAPENTIFNVASMTKPFIAMLTLKLVANGTWDMDEPLFHYWVDPDIATDPQTKKLTTRHVLAHQTGFKNWRRQNPNNKLSFDFEPGTKYQYSGEGFVYLGHALEQKFNKSLIELTDSILFKPIGMKDSRLCWDKNMDESRFAFWHDSKGNMYEPSTPKDRGVNAAGSLMSTVEDFCKFGIDLMNGAGLSPKLYDDMISPQVKLSDHDARGLGWEVISGLPDGEYALVHGGSDMGVQTMSVFLPRSKRGIVVLTNGDNGMFVYQDVIKEALDEGQTLLDYVYHAKEHVFIHMSDEALGKIAGTYKDSFGRVLSVIGSDGTLILSGSGVPTVKLYPETETKFFPKEFNYQFEFLSTDSLTISVDGKIDCTAKKIK